MRKSRTTPALTADEETYVAELLAGLDAYPAYYVHMAPGLDRGAWAHRTCLPPEKAAEDHDDSDTINADQPHHTPAALRVCPGLPVGLQILRRHTLDRVRSAAYQTAYQRVRASTYTRAQVHPHRRSGRAVCVGGLSMAWKRSGVRIP